MEKLRLRLVIRSLMVEAVKTEHFKERIIDRLDSEYSTFSKEKDIIRKRVFDNIEYLSEVTFPGQENIGIMLFNKGNNYIYHKVLSNGKIEHSEGRYIWIIIKGNDLETVVFGDMNYKPSTSKIYLDMDILKYYIEEKKKGDKNLNEKDISDLYNKKVNKIIDKKEIPKKEENVINIGGVNWIIDKENDVMFKKNNPIQKFKIDDVFNSFDEKTQEKLLNLMEGKLKFFRKPNK